MVARGRTRVMIDCGTDWRRLLGGISPAAIVLTHAHRDHVGGLIRGAPCPVYATATTWRLISRWPIRQRRRMPMRKPVMIGGITFEAFPVEHSMRAPAVGYRIGAGTTRVFYVPDVAAIRNRHRALRGVDLYVGDGAMISRPLVRRRKRAVIGHASIKAQLDWCRKARIATALFTHCGSQIVTGDARRVDRTVSSLGLARGIDARIAHDGLRMVLDPRE
jgi:phosphoribosyl 1,2-cyclic phosphodiesterase